MKMLNARLQISLIIICLAALVYLLYKLRARKLELKYTLPWLTLDLVMFLMALFPKTVVWLCHLLGIATPSNMVFFAALLFLLMIVYFMSRTIARLNNEIKELAQRLALDEVKTRDE